MATNLHPFIEVSVNGKGVSAAFYDRLISATIHDAAGNEADTCELVFDDAGNVIAIPSAGDEISVKFGFRDGMTAKMGLFKIEKPGISFDEGGDRLTLSGRSVDMRHDTKEPLSEHFDDKTIGSIVSEIAKRHKATAKVSDEFASIKLDYVARSSQSATDFLTRLADRFGAQFSIKGNKFLFMAREVLPPVSIDKSECESGEFTFEPRPRHGKTEAGWYDRTKNKVVHEIHSTGLQGPVKRLRNTVSTQTEAKAAAKAEAERLNRATGSGSISLLGRPEILADTPLDLTGFRPEVNGRWKAAGVDHVFDETYKISITLEAPNGGKA